jgi:PPM family protein phosphatase
LSRSLRIESAGCTDVGRFRQRNEDAFALDDDLGLYMVADGIGGHPNGDVAATTALRAVHRFIADPDTTWPPGITLATLAMDRLAVGVKAANQEIYEACAGQELALRMGTTFLGVLFDDRGMSMAYVGDSRCYRFRDGALEQLSEDHTLLSDLIWRGTPFDVASQHPLKNTLTRAVGIEESVKVSARFEPVRSGDLLLLCTDGLSRPVERQEIADILAEGGELSAIAESLVSRANDRGGPDNITAVLLRARESW